MMKNLWPCHSCLIIFGFWILTLELIYQIQIIFSCNLSHFWNQHHWKPRINISHLLWWYVSLSPPPTIYPWTRPLGVSFYPKQKTYLIFEIPTIENPRIVISNCLQWFQPPPAPLSPLRAPLLGYGGILNGKEILYLKS